MPLAVPHAPVLVASLVPLRSTGGRVSFTADVARAALAYGDDVVLAAPVASLPSQAAHRVRLATEFIAARPGATLDAPWTVTPLTAAALLDECAGRDYVALHDFLAADLVFDFIAALDSTQTLVLTALGHEPLLPVFATFYQRCANHQLLSISRAAAGRLTTAGLPARHIEDGPGDVAVAARYWQQVRDTRQGGRP